MLREKRMKQLRYVVDNSKYVHINKVAIVKLVADINEKSLYKHWLNDYKLKFTENEMILFLFLIESMNFCFWKEQKFYYNEMILHIWLDETLKNKKMLDLDYLINLEYNDFIEIFHIEEGNLINRYDSFMKTVRTIKNNPSFYNDLYRIKNVDSLYEFIVSKFDTFNDIAVYKGKEIFFYKRATLLVNDLFELCDTIRKNIQSIDSCLGCADYVIPKGLRALKILEYDKKLEEIINNNKIIEKGFEYEVKIRANMLMALELIKEKLFFKGIDINSIHLDNVIWKKSRGMKGENHKTDTIFY